MKLMIIFSQFFHCLIPQVLSSDAHPFFSKFNLNACLNNQLQIVSFYCTFIALAYQDTWIH